MRAPSDPRLLVMHGLRLKGFAPAPSIAALVGLAPAAVTSILDDLVGVGLATHREGRLTGFALTSTGREQHARLLAAELDAAGARLAVEAAYARFLGLNTDLLTICTDWQLREVGGQSTVNDHRDAVYDESVIDRLAHLHAKASPICEDLAEALDRFTGYGPGLAAALDRVRSGELDWFTKPMVASYHTVWFELHEDLLCTLGIERGAEGAA